MRTSRKTTIDALVERAAKRSLGVPAVPLGSRSRARGSVVLEFDGTSINSNAVEVKHGLGGTPYVTATASDPGRIPGISGKGETKFTITLQTAQGDKPPAGQKITVDWIAEL